MAVLPAALLEGLEEFLCGVASGACAGFRCGTRRVDRLVIEGQTCAGSFREKSEGQHQGYRCGGGAHPNGPHHSMRKPLSPRSAPKKGHCQHHGSDDHLCECATTAT